MATYLITEQLIDYMQQYDELSGERLEEMANGVNKVFGEFLYDGYVPTSWHLQNIERNEDSELIFHWVSQTEKTACPECNTISHRQAKLYDIRRIQDLPMSGMAVYHNLRISRYWCGNPQCAVKMFAEQFLEIADKDSRFTCRLKTIAINIAIESSCLAASKRLKLMGAKMSKDTVNRAVKKKGFYHRREPNPQ